MNLKEIEQKIIAGIAEEMGLDDQDVTPNADLEIDLGMDSLDKTEIVMRFEEEFDIEIPDGREADDDFKTVANVIQLVTELVAAKGN